MENLNIFESLIQWILIQMGENPYTAVVLVVIGSFRLIFKPLCDGIQKFVDGTESKKDDAWWLKVQENKIFKAVAYVLNLTASIKLPAKKEEKPAEKKA